MGELQQAMKAAVAWWSGLTRSAKVSLSAVGVALAVAIGTLTFVNSEPTMGVLFSGLSQADSGRILERLSTMGVVYRYDQDTSTVMVPKGRVHGTRLTLATEGLPGGTGVGFEVFDQQRFGESEFSEQVKYHRALEGELGRTISHLAGVRRARIHLVLPKRTLFVSKASNGSASVALHLKPGWRMSDDQVRGIVHLVASSVRGLEPGAVIVVDGEGRRLGGGDDGEGQTATDSLGFRRELEQAKERAAEEILATTLGPGRSVVRVAAEVNFTREERTEERFDPEGVAARSYQISQESDSANAKTVGGVPGTPSNLPGGEAATGGDVGKDGAFRRSETRNFEVSKVLKHTVEPVGRVVRLQVAVVVDGKWVGEGEERAFEPMPQAERDQIKALVTTAVGLDADRGDKVTVESLPFATPEPVELTAFDRYVGPYAEQIPTVVAIIVGGLLLLVWMRRRKPEVVEESVRVQTDQVDVKELGEGATEELRKQLLSSPEERDGVTEPEPPMELEAGVDEEPLPTPTPDKMEEIRQLASELAGQEPEAAARVIRGWLAEGGP